MKASPTRAFANSVTTAASLTPRSFEVDTYNYSRYGHYPYLFIRSFEPEFQDTITSDSLEDNNFEKITSPEADLPNRKSVNFSQRFLGVQSKVFLG